MWWWPDNRSTGERRLEAELPSYKLHVKNSIKTRGESSWSERAMAALAQAEEALHLDNFAEALIAFDRARREEIPSLDEHEVSLRAISLLHQSEQLNAGTRDAVREILKAASKTAPVTAMQLAIATELRDEDFQSTFFLMERLNRHLLRLCVINTVILLVAVLSVVLLARLHLLSGNPTVLLGVVGFGALGAAASTMMSIMPPIDGPIPSQLKTGVLLFARPLFGATAAVAVYVFLKMDVLKFPVETEIAYFGFAFAAGFSDRLLLSALSKVAASSIASAKGKGLKAR